MDYLKIIKDEREIIKALKMIRAENNPVIVWQVINGKRVVAQAKIQLIDSDVGIFALKPLGKTDCFNFKSKVTFYMKGEHRSLLFKQDRVKTNKRNIVLRIPEVVRMYEKRDSVRSHFGFLSPAIASIFKPKEEELDKDEMEYQIYDISTNGISLIIPHRDQGYFYPHDELGFHSLGQTNFDGGLTGEMVYINPVTFRSNGIRHSCFKMGIRFNNSINQKFINQLLKEAQALAKEKKKKAA